MARSEVELGRLEDLGEGMKPAVVGWTLALVPDRLCYLRVSVGTNT